MNVLSSKSIFLISVFKFIKIGMWSKLSAVLTFQLQMGKMGEDANMISGELLLLAVTLVYRYSLSVPYLDSLIASATMVPLRVFVNVGVPELIVSIEVNYYY